MGDFYVMLGWDRMALVPLIDSGGYYMVEMRAVGIYYEDRGMVKSLIKWV